MPAGRPPMDPMARIMTHVREVDEHWLWVGAWTKPRIRHVTIPRERHLDVINVDRPPARMITHSRTVFPLIKFQGKNVNVRRLLYAYPKLLPGSIQVRVACGHPQCVKPLHLQAHLCLDPKTLERPQDPRAPEVDENVLFLAEQFRSGNMTDDQARAIGATEDWITQARRLAT